LNTTNRIQYLDSIRGLAALSVVIFHCISNHWGYRTDAKISFLLFNGSDAVSLFFVLSGLVLTLNINQSIGRNLNG
jgi:peptidoglycan/LPS O-acetylase OafA/YrhL